MLHLVVVPSLFSIEKQVKGGHIRLCNNNKKPQHQAHNKRKPQTRKRSGSELRSELRRKQEESGNKAGRKQDESRSEAGTTQEKRKGNAGRGQE